jgi:hypothetical protein
LKLASVVVLMICVTTDASFNYAGIASRRLLSPRRNGVLFGPRSPNYQKDEMPAR